MHRPILNVTGLTFFYRTYTLCSLTFKEYKKLVLFSKNNLLVLYMLQNAKREELEQTLASKLDMKKASKLCNEVSAYNQGCGPVFVYLAVPVELQDPEPDQYSEYGPGFFWFKFFCKE
jgi:hypothetical protein